MQYIYFSTFQEYDWTEKEISYILSSFFWGYVCTQFLGGILCKKFGAKINMGVSTFVSALLTVLTPWCVGWGGWQVFCAIRVIQGLVQGVIFPCIYEHLALWSPAEERNRLGGFSMTGVDCGTILAMAISGIIAKGSMGWPGISYVSAGICFAWCLLWLILGSNSPNESKFITESEKQYLELSVAHKNDSQDQKIPVPWKAVLTSLPFYALIVARSAQNWGLSTMQSQIPSYLNGVLDMEIQANGLFSSLPFMGMLVMSFVYLMLEDVLRRKKILTLKGVRRVFNTVSFWIPACGLIGIGFLDGDNKPLAISLMTLSVAINSGNIIGSALNTIDLAPNHAGSLMSVVNTVSNFTPFISPLVVGVIVTDVHERSLWQIVFAIAAAIFFFGNFFYITCGTTDTQPWDAEDFLIPKVSQSSERGYNKSIDDLGVYNKGMDLETNISDLNKAEK
ncbi:putative inorganic phosphate cotransporter [Stomoxys calcitrans]|uniref:putative inorganic phosphate cotransporter n=1 Tax=Stomoxys calcitrans TaxID=35570 RepID=UPI0027E338FE|nr:putative inorganic phosphate cotransporter [Stomoxys calcitrans]